MDTVFRMNWGVLALRGALATAFGLYALLRPGQALATLIMVFGAMVLVAGILSLVAGLRRQSHHRPIAAIVVEGIICIAFGLLALFRPGATAVAWLFLVSGFAIVSGLLHLAAGLRLRKETPGEWVLVADGVLTVVLGILMVLLPWAGLLALVWLIGGYSLFFGILLLVTAFRVRAGGARRPRQA
ncbi:MAG TPA: HdeD family acid-resistance protein [Candidatus Bathyarchaeia archaeon]|nr:HdeD family acid-resistance protein [Candidatus Bathyarchaeia archaeon]